MDPSKLTIKARAALEGAHQELYDIRKRLVQAFL